MRYILAFLLVFSLSFAKDIKIKDLPEELSKYYPPNSEKMEFLNLMHRLTVSITGLVTDVRSGDWENAKIWAEKLEKNYLEIGKMVPRWDKLLRKNEIKNVVQAAKERNKAKLMGNLQRVGRSCVQCHRKFQLSAKIKFHSPDFTGINIEDPVSGVDYSYEDYMKKMTNNMKLLKIYLIEGKNQKAKKAGIAFIKRFEGLSTSCSECHTGEKSEKVYFGKDTKEHVKALRAAIVKLKGNEIKKHIGWISKNNCAKCHNVHKTLYQLREKFGK